MSEAAEVMTIHATVKQLRQEANARGGSTLLIWAADTLEQMHRALAEAEYMTDCMHCKHRDAVDSSVCATCDCDCDKCEDPCPCKRCTGGSEWEWRGEEKSVHAALVLRCPINGAPCNECKPGAPCAEKEDGG